MRVYRHDYLLVLLALCSYMQTGAQTHGLNKSVRLEAMVQDAVPRITLKWKAVEGATSYSIFRKAPGAAAWGSAVAFGLNASTLNWADSTAEYATEYEYCVRTQNTPTGNGYLLSGVAVPADETAKQLLLVLDTTHLAVYASELAQWELDLKGEGWKVKRIPVSRTDSVTVVKQRIVTEYNAAPEQTKSVLLLGRVPVPYSGSIVPDGHLDDHQGAWPADGYYGEMNGNWTDASVNWNYDAFPARIRNVPGDGKFDQNAFPTEVELAVGRVDMSNLSLQAPAGEPELIRRYLVKNHLFRTGQLNVRRRALIHDNFTGYPEGFSASGWRSFSAIIGSDSIVAGNYRNSLQQNSYLWSYGCGAGGYTSASGIVNSTQLAADSLRGVFTMLFGSYFGDWDNANNLLRSALASGSVLTNAWSGRPIWHFHHMALGKTIGHSTRLAMNNNIIYDVNSSPRSVHMALMGDPSLTAFPVAQPQALTASYRQGHAHLEWVAAAGPVDGYYIYRRFSPEQPFTRLTPQLITETAYTDSCMADTGLVEYLVRSVRLETTPSGSYYNAGTGISDTLRLPGITLPAAAFMYVQEGASVTFTATATDTTLHCHWDFGDQETATGNVVTHEYATGGSYTVQLIVSHSCAADTARETIELLVTASEAGQETFPVHLFPNPATDIVRFSYPGRMIPRVEIADLNGHLIRSYPVPDNNTLSLEGIRPGLYIVWLHFPDGTNVPKKLVLR